MVDQAQDANGPPRDGFEGSLKVEAVTKEERLDLLRSLCHVANLVEPNDRLASWNQIVSRVVPDLPRDPPEGWLSEKGRWMLSAVLRDRPRLQSFVGQVNSKSLPEAVERYELVRRVRKAVCLVVRDGSLRQDDLEALIRIELSSPSAVRTLYEILRRSLCSPEAQLIRRCPKCNGFFVADRKDTKFCLPGCGAAARNRAYRRRKKEAAATLRP
jgi:hypothetical protein